MRQRLLLIIPLLFLLLPFSPLHAEEDEEKKEGPKKAVYLAVGNKFVVNIKEGKTNRFMQVKVQIMTRDEKVSSALEANMPAFSHAMIMLLAHQDGAAMRDIKQREEVRKQALIDLQQVLLDVSGLTTGLEAVYFTDFVIQ